MKTPFLVNANTSEAQAAEDQINRLVDQANRPLSQFKIKTGYALSHPETLSMIFSASKEKIYELQQNLDAILDKQIDSMGVSELLRENLKQGSQKYVTQLAQDLKVFSTAAGAHYLHDLTSEDGQIIFNEDAQIRVRDSFKNIITTDKAMRLRTLQIEVAEKLEALFQFVENDTRLHYVYINDLVSNFFQTAPGNSVIANELTYESAVNKEAPSLKVA